VTMPNVNTVTEMTDLITESRSYEADTQAMTTAKDLYLKTLDVLR
jgi:flagellar basal-body rod protein FlgC